MIELVLQEYHLRAPDLGYIDPHLWWHCGVRRTCHPCSHAPKDHRDLVSIEHARRKIAQYKVSRYQQLKEETLSI